MRIKPGLEAGFAEQIPVANENGELAVGINWVLSDDEFEQVRAGYRCLHCMEPFETPFPDTCFLCDYPVKSRQTIDLMREHQGEHRYGPTPLEDIYKLEDEQNEQKPGWSTTGSGIVVPNSI